MKRKYVFLDRDGTLIFEPPDTFQIDGIEKLRILDGVIEGLQKLRSLGYGLIMISNQDGLGTPSFPKNDFEAPHNLMLKIFKQNGIVFEKIFICPHLSQDKCACRKPKTGFVDKYLKANKNRIEFKKSFVCGDRESDKQFAKNLGFRFILAETNGSFIKVIQKLKEKK